ncbi:MAG: phage major capsid protein [Actinomycetota bacterium]
MTVDLEPLDRLERLFDEKGIPEERRRELRDMIATGAGIRSALDDKNKLIEKLQDKLDEMDVREQKRELDTPTVQGKNPFLTLEKKAAPWFKLDAAGYDPKNIRAGAILAAIADPNVEKHLNDDEQKAFNSLQLNAGDVTVPTAISALFIDAVRPATKVLKAGARTYPMEAQRVVLPGFNAAPSASWRGESGPFSDGGGSFREVVLHARMVGLYFDISLEVLQDSASNLDAVSSIIEGEAGRAIAQAVDRAALLGAGSAGEPLGIYNTPGVTIDSTLGTNGSAPSNYDFLINAVGIVEDGNFDPSAIIYNSRTAREFAKFKDTTNQPLRQPDYLSHVNQLVSNQIGNAFTKGSSNTASLAFTGQWDQLVIGFRPESVVNVLRDPYTQMAAAGNVRFYYWQRCDVGVLNTGAFCVSDGIL